MEAFAVAVIGAVALLASTLLKSEIGRRGHLSLIKAEAEALSALPADLPNGGVLRYSLEQNIDRYHFRNHPLKSSLRAAKKRLAVGLVVYFAGAGLFIYLGSSDHSSEFEWSVRIVAILLPVIGLPIWYPAFRKLTRYNRQLAESVERGQRNAKKRDSAALRPSSEL